MTFDCYHLGVKTFISSLRKLRVDKLNSWSRLEEAIRFLKLKDVDQHTRVLLEQVESMKAVKIGTKNYSADVIVRAFEYFCTSRALYSKLRQDYKLPSIPTLTNLTSKVGKLDENKFMDTVFSSLPQAMKTCVLVFDEVYAKKSLSFHGGSMFGRAVNKPDELAKTILAMMVSCQFGGPKFVSKMLPVSKLDTAFLKDEILETIKA